MPCLADASCFQKSSMLFAFITISRIQSAVCDLSNQMEGFSPYFFYWTRLDLYIIK
jgi:hypothetical protein